MRTAEEKIFLAELVDPMRGAILEAGAATAAEVDDLRDAVAAVARDPGTIVHQAVVHRGAAPGRPPRQPDARRFSRGRGP